MKFKILLSIAVAVATTLFIVSCDEDINTIGQGIQPGIDDIQMEIDEVDLTVETVSLEGDFYLRTKGALLGVLDDPILGKTKSDFLAEFFCPNGKFELGYDDKATIDSVFFSMSYFNSDVIGDTLSSMGVTIYKLNKDLDIDYNTNIEPSKYTDMKNILGQRYFSHPDLDNILDENKRNSGKHLYVEIDNSFGEELYKAWKKDNKIFDTANSLRKELKGIYVTSDFNNKTLIQARNANNQMEMIVCYSYKHDQDSTKSQILQLQIGANAIQMNSIIDTPLADTKLKGSDKEMKAHVKSPAGQVTKITIPLKRIREKAEAKIGSEKYMVNSSVFNLAGDTEKERELSIKKRPETLLFINKDSIEDFFSKRKNIDGISSLIMYREITRDQKYGEEISTTNIYNFGQGTTSTTETSNKNNISSLINHYLELEKDKEDKTENLEYYLIPISIKPEIYSSGVTVEEISNTIKPSAAIFRTSEEYMKMSLVFSKFSEVKKR